MASFGEILREFKDNEEAENVIAIVEDEALQNGMIAWKSVRITYLPAEDCKEEDSVSKWEWMWSRIKYDSHGFGVVAGAKTQEVGQLIARLSGLRLIYPDGTVNNLAKLYLRGVIFAKIGGKSKKPTPATNSTPEPAKQSGQSSSVQKSGESGV